MKMHVGITLGILLVLDVPASRAAPVYTWVDNEGITHFSEAPPADPAIDAQQLIVQPASGPAQENDADEGFYSIINQADRMESRRLEREKLTAERKLAEAEASKARAAADATYDVAENNPDNALAYPHYFVRPRPPWHRPWPGHHGKPVHPSSPGYSRPSSPRTSLGKTRSLRR